ncbi:MAG: hypothetical protein PHQ32_04515 [Firmicutes bacterium]|nr:hypothetical protein [Bacillota bacterium]
MTKSTYLKTKLPHIISIGFLVILSSLLLYRSLFGFYWSDETFYSTAAYVNLMSGDIFQNIQYMSFWPLFLAPFIDLYRIIVGNTDGIFLFLRICFNILNLSLALYLYKTAVRVVTPWVAALASSILLFFLPVNIPTLSNVTIVILMTLLSFLLISNGITGKKVSLIHILLSGFTFGIAVLSFPAISIAIIVLPIHILTKSYHIGKPKYKWNWVLAWIGGFFIIPVLILGYVFSNYSLAQILENINNALANIKTIDNGLNFSNVFIKYFQRLQEMFPISLIWFLVGGVLAFINTLFKKERLNFNSKLNEHERLTYIGSLILLIFFVILEFLMFVTVLSNFSFMYALIPLTLAMPMLYFMTNKFSSKYTTLYIMGILLSFALFIGLDNSNFYFAGFLLSTIAVILYFGEYLIKEDFDIKSKIPIYGIIFYFGFSIIFSLGTAHFNLVYHDEPINQLKTKIEAGPAKGIYTTGTAAENYDKLYNAIKEYVPNEGTVFFTRSLPLGYLITEAEPAFPQLVNMDISTDYLNEYFKSNYYILPDCVFQVADGYGYLNEDGSYSNDNNPVEGSLGAILKSDVYKKIKLDCATIYLKIK